MIHFVILVFVDGAGRLVLEGRRLHGALPLVIDRTRTLGERLRVAREGGDVNAFAEGFSHQRLHRGEGLPAWLHERRLHGRHIPRFALGKLASVTGEQVLWPSRTRPSPLDGRVRHADSGIQSSLGSSLAISVQRHKRQQVRVRLFGRHPPLEHDATRAGRG